MERIAPSLTGTLISVPVTVFAIENDKKRCMTGPLATRRVATV
jgi:hypothetical protein